MTDNNENCNNALEFRVATINDHDKILEFLRVHYYPEEPITIGNEPKQHTEEDEEFSMNSIYMKTSIIAIDRENNDKIVGVIISGAIDENDADDMIERSKYSKSKKWSEILQLFVYLEKNANVFKRYNVEKSLHMHVLGVDANSRGKSIGVKLMGKCMEIGKKLGYKIASVDCTSVYSIRLAEKMNMECVNVLAYSDYTDHNGCQLFKPPLPHTHIKTFIKIL